MGKKLFMGLTMGSVLMLVVGVLFAGKLAPMLEKVPGVSGLMDKIDGADTPVV
tara:strand:+ start:3449 stop:3607 length:159 start_codon:yes stop_codon:yes gene_type:complete